VKQLRRKGAVEEEERGSDHIAFQTHELEKCLCQIQPAKNEAKTTKPVKPVFSSRRLPEKHTLSLAENNSHLSKSNSNLFKIFGTDQTLWGPERFVYHRFNPIRLLSS